MLILQIFLAVLWGAAVIGTAAGCVVSIFLVTEWARGLTLASGIALRILAAAAVEALLVGVPASLMGLA